MITYRIHWAHPERTRARRSTEGAPQVVVIHTSEQAAPGVTGAEQLAKFIAAPASRNADGKITNQASYHWCVDLDSVNHMVKVRDIDGRDDIAFHAPPNWRGESICLTGRASRDWTGQSDGVDDYPQLRLASALVAARLSAHGWPAVKLNPDQVRAGAHGICGHHDISMAFGQTNHTDPGAGFPWAEFVGMVRAYMAPPPLPIETIPATEAPVHLLIRNPNRGEVIVVHDGSGISAITPETPRDRDAMAAAYKAVPVDLTEPMFDHYIQRARG